MRVTTIICGIILGLLSNQPAAKVELTSKVQAIPEARAKSLTGLIPRNKSKANLLPQHAELNLPRVSVQKVSSGPSKTELYFSNVIDQFPINTGDNTFDCVGGIYAVIKFPASDHQLRNKRMVVEWVNPQGEVELVDQQAKYAEQDGTAYRWGGIVLRRPQGGGLFSFMDPSAGMERFIGKWQVNISLDGQSLPSQSIQLEC